MVQPPTSTLPETNSSPLKIGNPKRKRSYSNHPFSGATLVSGRVSDLFLSIRCRCFVRLKFRGLPWISPQNCLFRAPGNHCSWRRNKNRASLFQNGHAFLLESFLYLSDQHLTRFFFFFGGGFVEWVCCPYKWFDKVGHDEVGSIVGRIISLFCIMLLHHVAAHSFSFGFDLTCMLWTWFYSHDCLFMWSL